MDTESCEEMPSYGCFRIVIIDIISMILIIITLFSCFRILKFYKQFVFEILPLLCGLLQAFFEFLHNVLLKSMELLYTSFYLEVLTFLMIAFSFIKIYFSLKQNPNIEKFTNIFSLLMLILVTLIYILGLVNIPKPIDCINTLGVNWLIFMVCELCGGVICIFFGCLLLKELKKNEKKNTHAPHLTIKSVFNTILSNQLFFDQQKKNVLILMTTFLIKAIFAFIWDCLSKFTWKNNLTCENGIIEAVDDVGQTYLLLRSFISLIPCFVMVYVFYYIPIGKNQIVPVEDVHFDCTDTMTAGLKRNDHSLLENLDIKWKEDSLPNEVMDRDRIR